MTNRFRWDACVVLLLACATACGGSKSGDDDSGAGEAGESGSGGAGGSGGTGGAGGTKGGAGGTTGGASTGGTGGTTGGASTGGTGGGAGGTTGGAGGAGGATGGAGGMPGGSGGSMSGAGGTAGGPLAPGFTEGAVLAEGVGVADDPKLAVNRAGDALVVWPGGGRIWTIRYDPTTEAWGEPFAINTDETFDAELHDIALDELGNAYIAWKQGFIFVTRYDAQAGEWADAVQIEEHDDGSVGDPRIAAGPNGTAQIIWVESDGSRSIQRTRRYDAEGDAWSYWEAIDERDYNGSGIGALAIDSGGNTLAVWTQSGESGLDGALLVANRFDAETATWSTVEVLEPQTPETNPFFMTLAVDPDDNFFLVWENLPPELSGDSGVWARRYVAASGWEEAVKLENQDAFATTEPHLALDANGNAMVVWTADDHLWSTTYSATASSWSEPVQVDDTAGWVAKWASVAMAPDGDALVVSSQYPMKDINLDVDAVASRYDAQSGTWSASGLLERHDYSAYAPVVGMDGQGKGHVVWWRETKAELWVSRYE